MYWALKENKNRFLAKMEKDMKRHSFLKHNFFT
jgi:hypothetical protein